MKKKTEHFIKYGVLIILLYFCFTKQTYIHKRVFIALNLFFDKVFPTLFPIFIITNTLMLLNLPYYINKLMLKIFHKPKINLYVLIMSLICGTPANAVIIKELVNNKYINKDYATYLLSFTLFNNPIFLFNMLSLTFNKKVTLLIIMSNYIINFILYKFLKHSIIFNNSNYQLNHYKFSDALLNGITRSLETMTLILGTLVFFNILIFSNQGILHFIESGLFELTNGLNIIPQISVNLSSKILITFIILSINGLSIQMQIKSIIDDTYINYRVYIKNRLIHLLLSILFAFIVIIITNTCGII